MKACDEAIPTRTEAAVNFMMLIGPKCRGSTSGAETEILVKQRRLSMVFSGGSVILKGINKNHGTRNKMTRKNLELYQVFRTIPVSRIIFSPETGLETPSLAFCFAVPCVSYYVLTLSLLLPLLLPLLLSLLPV